MMRCLERATQGRGLVGNGALVGAVLVRDGMIIAEGFHAGFGKAHAERDLLEKFTEPIQSNDILYVNLEPCCHHGKTPPCTDILLERGIRNVVYGMQDPDVRVAGQGIMLLRSHGIEVIGPICLPLCERFNKGFISVRTHNRPYITLKKAMMPDGRISNDDGSPMKITSDEQNIWSHTNLRATHDAILVGVGTVIADNPRLDTRLDTHARDLHPYRIVLDATLRTPADAHVVTDLYSHRTIIVHGPVVTNAMEHAVSYLRNEGVRLIEVPIINSSFDWQVLWSALMTPDSLYHGLTSILVEGGAKTWDMFKQAQMMDEEVTLIGGE